MFDSNDRAKTICHLFFERPVSANTVPMVRKTESIPGKFENTLKFFVVEWQKVGENPQQNLQLGTLCFNLVQNSCVALNKAARRSHFEIVFFVLGQASFRIGWYCHSAITIVY